MMRKSLLRQHADRYLKEDNRGSCRVKSYRRFVLHNMINALFAIGEVPPKWYALQSTHLQKLIAHWKEKNITPATIMKYMTVIRLFLQAIGHYPIDIDNKHLGLIREKSSKISTGFSFDILEKITDPITISLLHFQIYFGLTFSEAIRLRPDVHIQQNTLWITREIASNSKDRVIPLRTAYQAKILQELLALIEPDACLMSSHGYDAIRHTYRKNLIDLKLPTQTSYRYLYAQIMHKELSPHLSHHELTHLLMRELGLQSRVTVWGYLQHE